MPEVSQPTARPVEILLVEDNPGDVRLTMEVFKNSKVANRITPVGDGVEAMEFLQRTGRFAAALRPDLILLDLKLPGMDGRQVLAEIKSDPKLKEIPVVILTSSSAEDDILNCYRLQASCYITKPHRLEQFQRSVEQLEEFWTATVRLPRG